MYFDNDRTRKPLRLCLLMATLRTSSRGMKSNNASELGLPKQICRFVTIMTRGSLRNGTALFMFGRHMLCRCSCSPNMNSVEESWERAARRGNARHHHLSGTSPGSSISYEKRHSSGCRKWQHRQPSASPPDGTASRQCLKQARKQHERQAPSTGIEHGPAVAILHPRCVSFSSFPAPCCVRTLAVRPVGCTHKRRLVNV